MCANQRLMWRISVAGSTRRFRDPIHGLIVFDLDDEVDALAWKLIETPEFQRLRRIKQLGVSELVFPGATHSRFAHSVGVYKNARDLMKIIEREEGKRFDKKRAQVILIAALLHDIGHGPFSHAFEDARKAIAKSRGIEAPPHEKFTERLIRDPDGELLPLLEDSMAHSVADIFARDDPDDIYHAVVSSSFDADRLDYLVRDRYMTGTGAGAIDRDWLIDNLTAYSISVHQDDDEPQMVRTFVFKAKARQAAEDFLLARYRLYTQVYLHKTTRGFEKLATALFRHIADETTSLDDLGLDQRVPLVRFLRKDPDSLPLYRALDDTLAWAVIGAVARGSDDYGRCLATRLLDRQPPLVLNLAEELEHDPETLGNAEERLESRYQGRIGKDVFKDSPSYNLYARIGGEAEKEHKKVRVIDGVGGQREITDFDDTIIGEAHEEKRQLHRYYFLNAEERRRAEKAVRNG